MATSDPRKIRPVGDQGTYDAEEDPLVELARIVSEDGGFSGKRSEKVSQPRAEPSARGALSANLEAELLQELEASFAARQAPAPPRPVPAPSVQPIPRPRVVQSAASVRPAVTPLRPEPSPSTDLGDTEADDLLRSIEEQLGQFERRAQAARAASTVEQKEREIERTQSEPKQAERVQAARPIDKQASVASAVDEWRPRRAPRPRSSKNEGEVQSESVVDAAAPVEAHSDYHFRGPAADHRRDRQPDQARADKSATVTAEQHFDPAETRVPTGRSALTEPVTSQDAGPPPIFAKRNAREQRSEVEEFRREARGSLSTLELEEDSSAEQMARRLARVEAEISKELDPHYRGTAPAEQTPGVSSDRPDEPRAASVAAAREQITRMPSRGAPPKRVRSSRTLLTAASVVVVAAIGGAAALYLRSSEKAPSGPPPVIAAPEGSAKVAPAPEEATASTATVGEAVYNRVAGNASESEERVVDSAEEPREIARIVLPSTESDASVVRSVGEESAEPQPTAADPQAPETAAADEIGPRKVQTFVVRPDGTIVATDKTEAGADPVAGQQQQLAAQTEQIEPVPVSTIAIGTPRDDSAPAAPEAAPVAAPALAESAPPVAEIAPAPEPAAPALAAVEPNDPPAMLEEESAMAATEPSAAPVPSVATDGYVVQVSSQRSREQAEAAFADLQQRYASVLGGLSSSVQEAEVEGKGTYYRVRVGPWATRDEAITVCETLKGAGGACFVTQ